MKKANIIWLAVFTVLGLTSYGASCKKKKDRCPTVGKLNPTIETTK